MEFHEFFFPPFFFLLLLFHIRRAFIVACMNAQSKFEMAIDQRFTKVETRAAHENASHNEHQ